MKKGAYIVSEDHMLSMFELQSHPVCAAIVTFFLCLSDICIEFYLIFLVSMNL